MHGWKFCTVEFLFIQNTLFRLSEYGYNICRSLSIQGSWRMKHVLVTSQLTNELLKWDLHGAALKKCSEVAAAPECSDGDIFGCT